MKKIFMIALTLIMLFSASSCAKTSKVKKHITAATPLPTPVATVTPTPTATPTPTPAAVLVEEENSKEVQYIGNKNSMKFHFPDCGSLPAERNRVNLYSYEEAIDGGFSPCKRCNPF